jgi:predicted PurR-regulated permease PerM
MNRRLALLLVILIFILIFGPAYYPTCDDLLRQASPLCDAYNQPSISTGAFFGFNHNQSWTGDSLSWDIAYRLPQYIPSSQGTRAPPA